MCWKKAVLIVIFFVIGVSGIAYAMPAVEVGASPYVFNSTTGCDISYTYTSPYSFNGYVNILDNNGLLVRSYDTGVHAGGDYSLHWSGDYANSIDVPDGNYMINATLALDGYLMTERLGNANPMVPVSIYPAGMVINESGYSFILAFLLNQNNGNCVYVLNPDGSFLTSFEYLSNTDQVSSITLNESGYIFLVVNQDVVIFSPDYSLYGALDKSSTGTPRLSNPACVAFNSSNYAYVLDKDGRVYVFSPDCTYFSSWGSTGSDPGQFNTPMGIDIDRSGRVYVADTMNNRVQKFDCNGGFIKQWSGLDKPSCIGVDDNFNVCVMDGRFTNSGDSHVHVYDSDGNYKRSWDVSPFPSAYYYISNWHLSLMNVDKTTGNVIISDLMWPQPAQSSMIPIINVTDNYGVPVKTITQIYGSGDLYKATDVAINASGYIYTICAGSSTVQIFDPDGNYAGAWSYAFEGPLLGSQMPSAGIAGIAGIAINRSGYVYIADYNKVLVFDSAGTFVRQWVAVDSTNSLVDIFMGNPVASITGICLGLDDNVYVTCNVGINGFFSDDPARIRVFSPDGVRADYQISSWGAMNILTGFLDILLNDESINEGNVGALLNSIVYNGIAVNSTDLIYTTVPANNSILIYDLSGSLIGALNGTNTGAGAFSRPTDIAINSSDCVFVLDSGNSRIVVLDRDNRFITQFGAAGTGDGQFSSPQGLGLGSSGSMLAIADTGNNRVQAFEYFGRYYDQVQVTVDNTPPVISGAPTTAANMNGWYSAPVRVHFSASDALSGVLSCTGDQIVSGEGANQSVTGTAFDEAGNTNVTTVGINIDLTAPVIGCNLSGDLTGDGRLGLNVLASLDTNDSLSGVDSVKYSFDNILWTTYSGTFTVPFGDPRTLYYTVTDKAGNSASGSSYLNFAPASYFSSGGSTPTPAPSPSPTLTVTPTPVATPVNSSTLPPEAPGETVSPSPVGTDMLPGIVLIVVIVALLLSRKK